MKITDALRASLAGETSLFAAQLLKEDVERLEKLEAVARRATSDEQFGKEAMLLGWTSGDLRTFELNPELGHFLAVVREAVQSGHEDLNVVGPAWDAFNRRRIDVLVGCLSRPRVEYDQD